MRYMCFALLVIFMCSFARGTCVTKTNAVERRVALRLASQAVVALRSAPYIYMFPFAYTRLHLKKKIAAPPTESRHACSSPVQMMLCWLDSARAVSTFSPLM
uniref:Secreted protein n=1 Tax=Rhipicephalus zambeziensis TaxID=60191 RepID=A0A224Y9M0_9ACAR